MFTETVQIWYNKYKRDLPWRHSSDPYIIWLSEIILQQTRVDQGLPYFYRFTEQFGNITEFASASEDEILKLWQGLGYYSRARNMHTTAKTVVEKFKGRFPSAYSDLLGLKGIGQYTAAAISSFAAGEAHAVVDGNVYRLLSRYFGIETPIDSTIGKKQFTELAYELLDSQNPGLYNQAVMEFGARQCKPVSPDCSICPLAQNCIALKNNNVASLPVKAKKVKIKERFFNYLVMRSGANICLNKRVQKDIWQNLHDFPMIETPSRILADELNKLPELARLTGVKNVKVATVSEEFKHILSHQLIFARFWVLESEKYILPTDGTSFWANEMDIQSYAFPKLVDIYLKKY
ncbi:A/G-specific adenine glycosylase [Solitalea koreensis]|uniref:Adenine DNA glycosylase n=1 Tax=Solitalea koreensis TaxID=543615 RepID=A0A521CHG5_9SPHI|nr:A/G-specific adenine glycosylase [Solitalea koreensis]SMO58181.1 A/G-specific DNA-adenine glycosylase [Solitalea koreensis]